MIGNGDNISNIWDDVVIIKNHFSNTELWYGKKTIQTENNWAEENSLSPFRAISGLNDFGSDPGDEAMVIGLDDTPILPGQTYSKIDRITIVGSSHTPPYAIRFVWGFGTMEDAILARQYTSLILTFDNFASVPFQLVFPRLETGFKAWAQAKHSVDNATIDFFVGVFGY